MFTLSRPRFFLIASLFMASTALTAQAAVAPAAAPAPAPLLNKSVQVRLMENTTRQVLVPANLGIIMNHADGNSLAVAKAYAAKRGIPAANIIEVNVPIVDHMSTTDFKAMMVKVNSVANARKLAGFAIAWQRPFTVAGNQSITSAVSDGLYTNKFSGVCNVTAPNSEFSHNAGAPLTKRISMLLTAGVDSADAKKLVARAGSGDGMNPTGTVYLVKTHDPGAQRPAGVCLQCGQGQFAVADQHPDQPDFSAG